MFRRKNKRSIWLSTLLEIEALYNEGYLYDYTSANYIWFSKAETDGVRSKVAIYLGPFSRENWWKVILVDQYREHLRRVGRLK